MRVMLLTARPELRSNDRLAEAAHALDVDLTAVDGTTLCALIDGGETNPIGDLEPEKLGAVLARIGNWRPETILAVLEALVDRGVATPNSPSAFRLGRDHWLTLYALAAAKLPVPSSVAGADPEVLAATAVRHLGLPVVVKQRRSRMGVGVIRCATRDHLEAVLDSLWRVGDEVVVQRWMSGGDTSLRVLVVGGEAVAAARFTAGAGEWRSNAARGGTAKGVIPEAEEVALAVAAAAVLGLGQCGVDIVQGDDGPVVIEVNPTPGFLRLEEATGVDIARALVRHAVACVERSERS
jgi:RimK family alpha-L-glutamate ligase